MAPDGDVPSDPHDDIDFISEDGNSGTGEFIPFSSGVRGSPTPVFTPSRSTPLEQGDVEGSIPRYAMWSMKYLQHGHLFSHAEVEVRERFGDGDGEVFVIDDGRKHCLISRKVGIDGAGCTYCLVAQISTASYEQLRDGVSPERVLSGAKRFSVCAVYEAIDAVSNVSVVERYDTVEDLPPGYLPPQPPITFE